MASNIDSAIVIDSFASVTGGATRVAIDEAIGLAKRGISVTYFAAIGPIARELVDAGVSVLLLDEQALLSANRNPGVVFQSLWNSRAYSRFDALLRNCSRRSTVVHVHGFSQSMSASPIRCAIDRGFRVVSTLHDYFSACPNGGFFDYRVRTVCDRTPLSLSCVAHNCDKRGYSHKLFRVVRTIAQQRLGGLPESVRHFITPSKSAADRLRPHLPPDAKYHLLPNPCAVLRAPPVTVGNNSLVAVIGRLSPEKGIDELLVAARRSETRLIFIGDGPLRTSTESSGMHTVTGWVSRERVFDMLSSVRCVVLPSLVPETYGLSVVDAAARGVPSIVTEICGVAERIIHGQTGWRVPAGDLDALTSCLSLLRSNEIVNSVGAASYVEYWKSPLTVDAHISRLLDIYDSVLQ